jgi:hypothetical protein
MEKINLEEMSLMRIVPTQSHFKKLIHGGEGHHLIIGTTGSTKTFAMERIMEEHKKNGTTIIHLANGKNDCEAGFCLFEPEKQYHLDLIKQQDEIPTSYQIKRYIPISQNIPHREIFESEIFSLDIKTLDRIPISFLLEESSESSSINILNQTVSGLGKSAGIFDLLLSLKFGKKKQKRDLFSMSAGASSVNMSTIINWLSRFRNNPLLMPHNFENNLDVSKILNDNSHYHVLDLQYLQDIKLRDFIQLYVLNEIIKAKSAGKIKKPVMICIDEIRTLCNANPLLDHQKILSKLISNALSMARSLDITVISASQNYADIDSSVRQGFSNLILGRTSALQDINAISNIVGMDSQDRNQIFGLGHNQFILLSEDLGSYAYDTWNFHAPRHMHCERGYNFEKMVKKKLPNRLKNHKDILSEFKEHYKNQEINARERLEKEETDVC